MANKKVVVAGMITNIRTTQTKKGDQMGFCTLEDINGIMDLVIFPKPWEKYRGLIRKDVVVSAKGRVDTQREGEPKILVSEIKELKPASNEEIQNGSQLDESDSNNGLNDNDLNDDQNYHENSEYISYNNQSDPEPDEKLTDTSYGPPNFDIDVKQVISEVQENYTESPQENQARGYIDSISINDLPDELQSSDLADKVNIQTITATDTEDIVSLSYILPPNNLNEYETDQIKDDDLSMLTIILRSTGDKERDIRRLKHLHGILQSNPGDDRFTLMIFEGASQYQLDFPNNKISINEDLIFRLETCVGSENVTVETLI